MANTTIGSMVLEGDGNSFIAENSCRKEAILSPLPLYTKDSDDTDVFDFGGTIKTLTLSGVFIGATKAACKTFIDTGEAFIQGQQDPQNGYPKTLTDDFRGTPKVKVESFESSKEKGEPLFVRWTFKFIQSSINA